jgi:hypothetical protein
VKKKNFDLSKDAVKSYLTNWLHENFEVLAPSQLIQKLIYAINNLDTSKNTKTSLNAELNDAKRLLTDNNPQNDKAACEKLDTFLKQVDSKATDESLTLSDVEELKEQAKAIKNNLQCA